MLKLLIPLFFFISCSNKNINSIDSYRVLEKKEENNFPKKYSVSINGDKNLENILESLPTVEISENGEFLVSVSKNIEELGGEKLFFGVIEIENIKENSLEKRFSFSGDENELNKVYKKVEQLFLRKRAFILEKRIDNDGETIFKINIGLKSGIYENMRVDIFSYKNSTSFLSGDIKNKKEKIATATVSNIIKDNYSWIILENKKLSNRVSNGDEVFIRKGDFGEYIFDGKLFIKTNKNLIENKLK